MLCAPAAQSVRAPCRGWGAAGVVPGRVSCVESGAVLRAVSSAPIKDRSKVGNAARRGQRPRGECAEHRLQRRVFDRSRRRAETRQVIEGGLAGRRQRCAFRLQVVRSAGQLGAAFGRRSAVGARRQRGRAAALPKKGRVRLQRQDSAAGIRTSRPLLIGYLMTRDGKVHDRSNERFFNSSARRRGCRCAWVRHGSGLPPPP